jgi:adenine phosphoribosyltransferase
MEPHEKVLIIDDVLATGGTIGGILQLVNQVGAEVTGIGFLMELSFLNGREKMRGYQVESLVSF